MSRRRRRGTQGIPAFSARPGAGWEKGVSGNADCLCELWVAFFRNKQQGEDSSLFESFCPATPEGKRKRKEEGPRVMVGTSLVPWNGPRGFCMLVKGLSGQEEDSGFQKTT